MLCLGNWLKKGSGEQGKALQEALAFCKGNCLIPPQASRFCFDFSGRKGKKLSHFGNSGQKGEAKSELLLPSDFCCGGSNAQSQCHQASYQKKPSSLQPSFPAAPFHGRQVRCQRRGQLLTSDLATCPHSSRTGSLNACLCEESNAYFLLSSSVQPPPQSTARTGLI